MWMNEYEVEEILSRTAHEAGEVPNLYTGARVLHALMEWTNANSDGWPYWNKPSSAAGRLMEVFHDYQYPLRFGHDRDGQPLADLPQDELKRLLAPIKSFLTKQGIDYRADLPWAALFPLT